MALLWLLRRSSGAPLAPLYGVTVLSHARPRLVSTTRLTHRTALTRAPDPPVARLPCARQALAAPSRTRILPQPYPCSRFPRDSCLERSPAPERTWSGTVASFGFASGCVEAGSDRYPPLAPIRIEYGKPVATGMEKFAAQSPKVGKPISRTTQKECCAHLPPGRPLEALEIERSRSIRPAPPSRYALDMNVLVRQVGI